MDSEGLEGAWNLSVMDSVGLEGAWNLSVMDSVGLEGWEEINMKLISHGFRRAGGIDHTYRSKHYLKIRKMTRAYDLLHNFVLMFCKNMGHFVVRSLNGV